MMAIDGYIVKDTLFGPEHVKVRAIDWDQSDRGIHQSAQHRCNSDAVYMAAPDQTPEPTDQPLPRGSHPYMVQGWFGLVSRCSIPFTSQIMSKRICREYAVFRLRGCSAN